MKKMSLFTVVSVAFTPFVVAAQQNKTAGVYMSINGGASALNDSTLTITSPEKKASLGFDFETKPGVAFSGSLGYKFGPNFSLEAEIAYQKNELDKLSNLELSVPSIQLSLPADIPIEGDINSTSGFLTSYYNLFNNSGFTPFISAGIGMNRTEFNIGTFTFPVNSQQRVYREATADGTSMAYHVGGGFSYSFSTNVALDLKYRYVAAVDLELEDDYDKFNFDYSSHNVYLGLRASF